MSLDDGGDDRCGLGLHDQPAVLIESFVDLAGKIVTHLGSI